MECKTINKKISVIISLVSIVFLMQLFSKPSVEINDRDWDIKLEIDSLKNQFNKSINLKGCELEKAENENYKLIIQNMHKNYNNQDERFSKMLESYLNVREEVQNLNYKYALCYEGVYPHRKEFNKIYKEN